MKSQLNTSYATILNLYEKYQDDLFKIYPLSLHYFQSKRHEQKEALRLLEAKLRLLKEWGYIAGDKLAAKGNFARNVYGYELILAELYAQGVLEELDEFGLGVLAAAVVFEPRKNQRLALGLSKTARTLRRISEEAYAQVKHKEQRLRIYPFSKLPAFHLASSMEAWLRGTNFEKILGMGDTDEGEVVRYFRMGIQLLREMNNPETASPGLQQRLKEAIRVINRGVVDAEKQLREG